MSGVLGLLSGIFAGVVGGLPLYYATLAGGGTFAGSMMIGLSLLHFLTGDDST
ncbi:hypothetical protein [Streptomyces rochei]|uniref:hypothetical protein n=1 Tax=Streptomyces rochei TaxID=1928 RepID=UPI0033BC0C2B